MQYRLSQRHSSSVAEDAKDRTGKSTSAHMLGCGGCGRVAYALVARATAAALTASEVNI